MKQERANKFAAHESEWQFYFIFSQFKCSVATKRKASKEEQLDYEQYATNRCVFSVSLFHQQTHNFVKFVLVIIKLFGVSFDDLFIVLIVCNVAEKCETVNVLAEYLLLTFPSLLTLRTLFNVHNCIERIHVLRKRST